MPAPNEALVRSVLGKNGRDKVIRAAVAGAWDTFLEKYPERAWWRRKTTRAGLVWEHSVENAIAAFSDDPGVKPIPHDDTVSIIFDQLVLLRFKKADLELRTRNYPTPLANMFHQHEARLPGFEDLQRVEAAYVLNQFQTRIDWVGIVARDKKKTIWNWELDGGGVIAHLPVADRKGTAADEVVRGKASPPAEKKREDEGE